MNEIAIADNFDPDERAGLDDAPREPLVHPDPPEWSREIADLKALNEWKHGGMLILSAPPFPKRLPLWRGLVSFGKRKP